MKTDFLKVLQSFAKEKDALAVKERQLVAGLKPVLDAMGYTLVEANQLGITSAVQLKPETQPSKAPTSQKTLVCSQCGRRFAQPMHLGRHLAAAHHALARTGGAAERKREETAETPQAVTHGRPKKTTTRRTARRTRTSARTGKTKSITRKVA